MDDINLSIEELEAETRTFDSKQRRKYADSGIALPDGSYPIPDKDALRRAIQAVGRASNPTRAKSHIIKRARALGLASMLPDDWNVAAEDTMNSELPDIFQSVLVLDGKIAPKAMLLEQTDAEKTSGTLKVRMPFYIGETVANIPHIPRRVYFRTSLLSETIREGKNQIAAGQQPLTVYARHAHALADDHLPIGAIVNLEQEGSIGYATLEIEPTTEGKDAQILLKADPPKLNAISLRSGLKRFELEEVKVDGEIMYAPTKLLLDGVDFAPTSPALKNYGREILAAEASVTPVEKKKKEVRLQVDEITLEAVRAKPEIVKEIERPLLSSLDAEREKVKNLIAEKQTLSDEIQKFKEAAARSELESFVREIAAKHPKSAEVLPVFMEAAGQCKTKEEFSAKILPYFVNAAAEITTNKEPTLEEKLRKYFPVTPSNGITAEEEPDDEPKGERVGALEVPG